MMTVVGGLNYNNKRYSPSLCVWIILNFKNLLVYDLDRHSDAMLAAYLIMIFVTFGCLIGMSKLYVLLR